ncbi:MAG: hypothetical protein QXW76_07130, partial [Candidatus Korarchaeum sp.]
PSSLLSSSPKISPLLAVSSLLRGSTKTFGAMRPPPHYIRAPVKRSATEVLPSWAGTYERAPHRWSSTPPLRLGLKIWC